MAHLRYEDLDIPASDNELKVVVDRLLEINESPSIHPAHDASLLEFGKYGAMQILGNTFVSISYSGNTTYPDIGIGAKSVDYEFLPDLCVIRASKFIFTPKAKYFGQRKYKANAVRETLSFQRDLRAGGYSETEAPTVSDQKYRIRKAVSVEHEQEPIKFSRAHANFLMEFLRDFNPILAYPLIENKTGEVE